MYLKIRDRFKHMSNTGSNFEVIGILLGLELRKRKTTQEKIAIHLAAWSCRRLKFTGRVSGGFSV
ncbi:hypothetical protein EEI76_22000 (plasmid) [Enterobacter cloacae]|nr:hypothetical protein EEI76_22000 [Enterobacter cloacae]UKU10049.1 hypothetical protein [Enterobacter asburiae]